MYYRDLTVFLQYRCSSLLTLSQVPPTGRNLFIWRCSKTSSLVQEHLKAAWAYTLLGGQERQTKHN
jgi:hypothetical protein